MGEIVVLDALVHHNSVSARDAQLMRNLVPLGLATVAVLFLLSTVVPASSTPKVPSPANATLIIGTAVVVAVYSAEPILDAAYEPRSIVMVWIVFILCFAAFDWLVAWKTAREHRKRVAKRARFFSSVAPVERCAVVTRNGESVVTGWTATATAGVWVADEFLPVFARQAQAWSLTGPHAPQPLTVRLARRFDRPRLVVTSLGPARDGPALPTGVSDAEQLARDARLTLVAGRTLAGMGLRLMREA